MKIAMKYLVPLLALLCLPASAQTTISSLPAASSPLSGAELLAGVQGGVTKKLTAAQVASLSTGTGATWTGNPIGTAYGGLGANFGASTGVPSFSSGAASINATLSGALGGTGVANTGKTLTLGSSLITTGGASTLAFGATGRAYTFPDASDTVVLATQTQTLTNKTISGASNTLTNIGNGSLTNSAITLCGTSTSLGGSLTASACLDNLGSTRGSLLYRGASGWAALTPGTGTYVLTSNGAGADPSWNAIPQGSGVIGLAATSSVPGTFTTVPFDTAKYSSGGVVTCSVAGGTAGQCTVNTAGRYHIYCNVGIFGTSVTVASYAVIAALFNNGTEITPGTRNGTAIQAAAANVNWYAASNANTTFAANDVFTCRALQQLSGTPTYNGINEVAMGWEYMGP